MPASPSTDQPVCRPQYLDDPVADDSGCERCGYDISNGWHDGQIVEIEVECPKCGREISVLSGYLSLEGFEYEEPGEAPTWINGHAWEVGLGRDGYDKASYKTLPGSGRSVEIEAQKHPETRKFELVCTDQRRCRFRRVVGLQRASDAMVAAWRKGSHRVVAGIDL
jgi:hypothetical protein